MQHKLTLINEAGKTLDLLDERHLIAEASSLGFNINAEFINSGANFVPIISNFAQTPVSGTIYFKGENPYNDYFDFINFCSGQKLILEYNTIQTFRIPLTLTVATKKENTKDIRKADVTFQPLGLWYTTKTASYQPEPAGQGKIYDYTYPYTYGGGGSNEVLMYSDTNIHSPAKLTIYGPVENPTWNHYANGKLVATGGCTVSVPEGRKLVIDAINYGTAMTLQNDMNAIVANEYQNGDFTTERFIYLRPGNNRITVAQEATNAFRIGLEARLTYESV